MRQLLRQCRLCFGLKGSCFSNLSVDFPTKTSSAGAANPNNFNYGFAFEYSLEYLQRQVMDVGLQPPFNRMIPLVEMAFTTGLNRGAGGQTVGTVQPGIIWAGQYVQIGAEAILPVTSATGRGFGGVVQLHFYLDDIFPGSIGRPISRIETNAGSSWMIAALGLTG